MTQDAHTTRVATRAVLVTRITIVAALLLGAAIVTLQLATTLSIREEQRVSAERGKSIKSTAEQVESCTTPEGKCFQESQRRTGEAVNSIGQLSVYASACAADVDQTLPVRQRVRIIERCVNRLAQQPPAQPQQ